MVKAVHPLVKAIYPLVEAAHPLVVGKNTARIVNAAVESTERTQISAHWDLKLSEFEVGVGRNGCDATIRPSSALPTSTISAFMYPSPLLFKSYLPSNHPTSGWDKGPRSSRLIKPVLY